MTCSIDFRRRVLEIKEREKLTYEQTASRFGVGVSSLLRWRKRLEPKLTRSKPATKIDMDALRRDIEACPNSYQYERAQRLGASQGGIGKALIRLGVNRKKHQLHPKTGGDAR